MATIFNNWYDPGTDRLEQTINNYLGHNSRYKLRITSRNRSRIMKEMFLSNKWKEWWYLKDQILYFKSYI